MRFIYAAAGLYLFLILMIVMVSEETLLASQLSDDAAFVAFAIVFAGGLAGGK